MILVALLIGAILVVAAIRNSQDALFAALGTDVPGFVIWAAAIFALGAIGFVPGLKPVSRGLLALVIVVLVLNNYQKILGGFTSAWQQPSPTTTSNPSANGSGNSLGGSLADMLHTAQQGADLASAFSGSTGGGVNGG